MPSTWAVRLIVLFYLSKALAIARYSEFFMVRADGATSAAPWTGWAVTGTDSARGPIISLLRSAP